MSSSKYIFTLDLRSVQSQISLPVTQGDTNRTLCISFSDGAKPYILGEESSALMSIKRPTGTSVQEACEVEEGGACVIYHFSDHTCAVAGLHKCQLVLYNAEGKQIASPKFSIDAATRLVEGDNVIIPDDDVTAIDEMFRNEAARQAAERGRETAENERKAAERQREANTNEAIRQINAVKDNIESMRDNGDFDGKDGHSPVLTIQDGYWYIDGENTGMKAGGDAAEAPVKSVNGQTGDVVLNASDVGARHSTWTPTAQEVGARPSSWTPTYSDVGADKSGAASTAVSTHNTNTTAHNDIRLELKAISDRINAALDSDDTTLDELSEIVTYIKSNKSLIDAVTTSKVNVSDIINDLTSNVTNKPLSAAQGVALKGLIDALDTDKLDASALASAINTALAQAKASGEFDGADGDKGDKGADGADGKNGTDGVGIAQIAKTSTSGNVDTYTITLTNGAKSTFTVTNGVDGKNGSDGEKGEQGEKGDPYTLTEADINAIVQAVLAAIPIGDEVTY